MNKCKVISVAIGCMTLLSTMEAKEYSRCELIEELKRTHEMTVEKAATWTCLAISGRMSENGDVDPLQRNDIRIKDIYACKSSDVFEPCFSSCYEIKQHNDNAFMDCMEKLHDTEHNATGDGFNRWPSYESLCKGKTEQYLQECSYGEKPAPDKPPATVLKTHKVYDKCELAKELRDAHRVPLEEIGIWVCLAERSMYNASWIGDASSKDYGLWRISSSWWCGSDGPGGACGDACSTFTDEDITNDLKCAQQIVKVTKDNTGDGFLAWPNYSWKCKAKADDYVKDCGFETTTMRLVETVPEKGRALLTSDNQDVTLGLRSSLSGNPI